MNYLFSFFFQVHSSFSLFFWDTIFPRFFLECPRSFFFWYSSSGYGPGLFLYVFTIVQQCVLHVRGSCVQQYYSHSIRHCTGVPGWVGWVGDWVDAVVVGGLYMAILLLSRYVQHSYSYYRTPVVGFQAHLTGWGG